MHEHLIAFYSEVVLIAVNKKLAANVGNIARSSDFNLTIIFKP